MDGIIHLHKNSPDHNFKIFLLIIPIIIFTMIVAVLLSKSPIRETISSISTPNVLGETTEP